MQSINYSIDFVLFNKYSKLFIQSQEPKIFNNVKKVEVSFEFFYLIE